MITKYLGPRTQGGESTLVTQHRLGWWYVWSDTYKCMVTEEFVYGGDADEARRYIMFLYTKLKC